MMALCAVASTASKPTKKVRRVSKNELRYLLKRLRKMDMSIFEASVKQQVNEKEAIQFTQYPEPQTVWNKWSESDKLCVSLNPHDIYS